MMPVKLSEVGRTITLRFSPQDIWVGVRWERWSQGCEFRFSAESGHVIPTATSSISNSRCACCPCVQCSYISGGPTIDFSRVGVVQSPWRRGLARQEFPDNRSARVTDLAAYTAEVSAMPPIDATYCRHEMRRRQPGGAATVN